MNLTHRWEIPITTVSEANSSEHWTKKSKRHKMQQFFVRSKFNTENPKMSLPCRVKLTRLSARSLDSDNNVSAFKWIRDELSSCIIPGKAKGHADSDARIEWEYAQEKHPIAGIRIEIFC